MGEPVEEILVNKTCSNSFLIKIYRSQNMSWQGVIQWLDQQRTVPFRSELELVMLLHEALNNEVSQPGEKSFRTWKQD